MKYQLTNWKINGSLKDNGDGTSTQPVIVTAGIVGDTYGFIAPDPSKNMFSVVLSNKQLDIDEMKDLITQESIAFVAKTYPDTK